MKLKTNWLMAIDPGLQGTGVALFRPEKFGTMPTMVDILTAPRRGEWWDRCYRLAEDVERLIPNPYGTTVVVEMTHYMAGATRQMSWKTGDMQRLTFFIGALHALMVERNSGLSFLAIETAKWKGQLPKKVVEDRIKRKLGAEACKRLGLKSHEYDAVGIGLWALGVF